MTGAQFTLRARESAKVQGYTMSDLFFNKIAAAGLAAALIFIGINKIAGMAVHADIPSTPAYSKYVAGASEVVEDIPAPFPQAEWIAGIDPVKGAKVFKKCTSCHNADEGGKNGTGPALWNVLGRTAATGADFSYSPAMASSGITWNYAELDAYLTNPKAYVPKTKMAFIGVKKPADRAAVIEYLRLASSAPIAALSEAAAIPGAEAAHDSGEAHEIAADVGTDPMTVEHAVDGETHDTPAELPVDAEAAPMEKIEEAATEMADDAKDVMEAVEETVEDVKEAAPTPDGGH
jgi:cytochrome c